MHAEHFGHQHSSAGLSPSVICVLTGPGTALLTAIITILVVQELYIMARYRATRKACWAAAPLSKSQGTGLY